MQLGTKQSGIILVKYAFKEKWWNKKKKLTKLVFTVLIMSFYVHNLFLALWSSSVDLD